MQTRKVERQPITLPGRYFTGLGVPEDVVLSDLSQGGCRFTVDDNTLALGLPLQIFVAGAGPYRATVKWVDGGEVGVTFSVQLTDAEFNKFQSNHTPNPATAAVPGDFDPMPSRGPQRFC